MFRPDFMEWFENFRLPPYHLDRVGDQYELTFEGHWQRRCCGKSRRWRC